MYRIASASQSLFLLWSVNQVMEGASNCDEDFRDVDFPDRRSDAGVWEVATVKRESTAANGPETVAGKTEMQTPNTGRDRQTEVEL